MSEILKCHKCGCTDRRLFHHHKSYNPEIIVMVCMPCHKLLHNKLRKNGSCTIPPDELAHISNTSPNRKKQDKLYYQNNKPKRKKLNSEYRKRNYVKQLNKQWQRDYRFRHKMVNWAFYENMMPYVSFVLNIRVFDDGKLINISSRFKPSNGKNIYYIDII